MSFIIINIGSNADAWYFLGNILYLYLICLNFTTMHRHHQPPRSPSPSIIVHNNISPSPYSVERFHNHLVEMMNVNHGDKVVGIYSDPIDDNHRWSRRTTEMPTPSHNNRFHLINHALIDKSYGASDEYVEWFCNKLQGNTKKTFSSFIIITLTLTPGNFFFVLFVCCVIVFFVQSSPIYRQFQTIFRAWIKNDTCSICCQVGRHTACPLSRTYMHVGKYNWKWMSNVWKKNLIFGAFIVLKKNLTIKHTQPQWISRNQPYVYLWLFFSNVPLFA